MSSLDKDLPLLNHETEISVFEFQSYEEVRTYWKDLNRWHKDNELTFDWDAHKLIWDQFYKGRGAILKIFVGFEGGRCIAIFPLLWIGNDPCDPPGWYLNEDFIISREYFCPADKIHVFSDYLPTHHSDDMSCFYVPHSLERFRMKPGGVIDLKDSQEEYFLSLSKKSRHNLKRTLAQNTDIDVDVGSEVRWNDIQNVLKSQVDYWMRKNGSISEKYFLYSRDKINTDLLLMGRAQEMGKLIALYFYLNDRVVAANFSVRRENDRVDDYLCLRDCGEMFAGRGLGILSILKNMEVCRSLGIKYYDLSACLRDYEKKFMNVQSLFYYLDQSNIIGLPQSKDDSNGNSNATQYPETIHKNT